MLAIFSAKGDVSIVTFSGGGGVHFRNFEDIDFWFFANIIICDCTTYFAGFVIIRARARAARVHAMCVKDGFCSLH